MTRRRIDAILMHKRSATGNAAMCADDPHAERAQRVHGAERGPHRRRGQ
jgi:hypothetical protein